MIKNNGTLYLPKLGDLLTRKDIWEWYNNIPHELSIINMKENEKKAFISYYREAGLLTKWRNPFFYQHYTATLQRAVTELFVGKSLPRILDLGCGTGSQSLLFAILGAEVIGVDLDSVALDIFLKRKAFYESETGRQLNINIRNINVFDFDIADILPLDGVYSLFAFNMMQPTSELLSILMSGLSNDAVIAIQDGNRKHFFKRIFHPREVCSRKELLDAFQKNGFECVEQVGCVALPPVLWSVLPRVLLEPFDRFLTKYEIFNLSYLHLARKERSLSPSGRWSTRRRRVLRRGKSP